MSGLLTLTASAKASCHAWLSAAFLCASAALDSRRGLPSTWSTPFLTTLAGALPHGPAPLDVDEVCGTYLVSGASKLPPNVDVDFETVMLDSNGAALATTLNLTRSP